MRVGSASQREQLAELAVLLASSQMPVQMRIAAEVGVAQSLVSRARNGQLRRMTDKVDRLLGYARSRVDAVALAAAAAARLDEEADAAPTDVDRSDGGRRVEAYGRKALEVVEAYLADGYDPRLIVEQLAVLRRAQRVRRLGPSAGT